MRVLVAYDGSECARFAIADLCQAGLPTVAEACVVTAPEAWPALPPDSYARIGAAEGPGTGAMVHRIHELAACALAEARQTAQEGALRLRHVFPQWQVATQVGTDPPGQTIVAAAEHWKADLVVVGSHGRSAPGRFFFGSVSQKVVRYAPCTVRVAHHRPERQEEGLRLVIGLDGAPPAPAADPVVEHVARRDWPAGTAARILSVLDVHLAAALPISGDTGPLRALQEQASRAADRLRDRGLQANPMLRPGDPKHVLVREAEQWAADCLFVGARGQSRGAGHRFLVGSVSAAVVGRCPCTVEMVRPRSTDP